MDAGEMSNRLAQNAQAVAAMLLPGGKKDGHEWVCGSIAGEPGGSLKVHLAGRKAGVWADFATGENGDLIDLWRLSKNLTVAAALAEIRDYLGVKNEPRFMAISPKTYKRPEKPKCQAPQSDVLAYLTNERKLTAETIKAYQVGERGRDMVFPYKRGDELVMWKSISLDRDEHGKKRIVASKDSEPILFGWQAIEPNSRHVVICEGEIDAMTVCQWGYPALSVPFGGGSGNKQQWVDSEFHHLDHFREIYLCLDRDPAGQEATREIINRLGAHRCKVVDLLYFKDANDALQAGMGPDFFEDCLADARYMDPEELRNAADFKDQVERLLITSNDPAARITLPWPKTHAELRLEEGQLTIWSGFNGHGKSEMLLHFMVHRMAQGERVCIASMEVPPAKLIGRHILPMATASAEPSGPYRDVVYEWLGERLWLFNLTGTAKAERLMECFEYARKRYGVLHFVVDSLLKVGLDEDDYNGQKCFVERLCDFKNRTGAHMHLVAHARKRDEGESQAPKKHDVRGAGAITDLADNVLSVYRNKPKEEVLKENPPDDEEFTVKGKKYKASVIKMWPDAYLHCHKQREDGVEPSFGLWFDRGSRQFLEAQKEQPRRYVQYSGTPVVSLPSYTQGAAL
jgi:twinkle protein